MPETIVLATRNMGKVRELAAPLAAFGLRVVGLSDFPHLPEVEETGTSFLANARLKAEAVARATGHVAVADDSGLIVDALDGAPGVRSARYWTQGDALPDLGEDQLAALPQDERNIRKLLAALVHVPPAARTGRFCCAMCAVRPSAAAVLPEQHILTTEACWEGRILESPRGSGGFGYDPVFFDPELGLSAAEMPSEVKMSRSHRAKALQSLLALWPAFMKKLN